MSTDRGAGANLPVGRDAIGLPPRPFLYTLDQISVLLDMSETAIKQTHVYFEGRSTGIRRKDLMLARNIAAATDKPDWRVTERELVRWFRHKGFRYYERSAFTS